MPHTSLPTCAAGHESEYLTPCEWPDIHGCDNKLYCDEHLTQCDGCKRKFCTPCAEKVEMQTTDCGMLCCDCKPEYGVETEKQEVTA